VVEKLSIIEITRFVCLFVSFFHHPFSTAIPPCILDINLCEHRDSMLPPYTIEISSVPGSSVGTRVQNRPKLHGDGGGGVRFRMHVRIVGGHCMLMGFRMHVRAVGGKCMVLEVRILIGVVA
jgi:hypothetical protein